MNEARDRQKGTFSEDWRWWWTGTQWVPAVSADGHWRWNGTAWEPAAAAPCPTRRAGSRARSAWLIVLLTVVTGGLYCVYWFFATWRQVDELSDDEVHPVGHALASAIPLVGWIVMYFHVRKLACLGGATPRTRLVPGIVLAAWIPATLLQWGWHPYLDYGGGNVSFGGDYNMPSGFETVAALVIMGAILAWLQVALNAVVAFSAADAVQDPRAAAM